VANGRYAAPYFVEEDITEEGFIDDGKAAISVTDPDGNILSLAKGTARNYITASGDQYAGYSIDFVATVTAYAACYGGSKSYASAPGPYHPVFGETTGGTMNWNVYTDSILRVSDLSVRAVDAHTGDGAAWGIASWNITVQDFYGTFIAQYSKNDGASFTAPIPKNSVVSIYWSVMCMATAPGNVWGSASNGDAEASVSGNVVITTAP
jgi:hypothetical protein